MFLRAFDSQREMSIQILCFQSSSCKGSAVIPKETKFSNSRRRLNAKLTCFQVNFARDCTPI